MSEKNHTYTGFLLACIVSCLNFVSIQVYSQTDSNKVSILGFEELLQTKVVAASRSEQLVYNASANTFVITAEQISNRGYQTIEQVLHDLPGFDFSTGQPSGEYPTHFLFRGTGDVGQAKFALLVDGVSQNDVSNGWVRNIGYNFTIADIARIELISGPGSSLFGGNAYVGYLNIITKNGSDLKPNQFTLNSNMTYGSNNTIAPELLGAVKFKNGLSIQLAGRYFYSEGDEGLNRWDEGNYFHNNFEPDSVLTLTGTTIANELNSDSSSKKIPDGFKTNIDDYSFRGKINLNRFTIAFSSWRKKEGLGSQVTGYEYFTNSSEIDYLVHHKGSSLNLTYDYKIDEKVHSLTRMYYNSNTILPQTGFTYTWRFQSVDNGIDTVTKDTKKSYNSKGFLIGLDEQLIFTISKNNHLLIGTQIEQKIREYFDIQFIDEDNSNQSSTSSNQQTNRHYLSTNSAFFIQDEQKLFNHSILTAGFRYDIDPNYGQVLNPRLSFTRGVRIGLIYKILYGQGFKPPTVFELFDEWRGNKNLSPEINRTGEIEIGYNFKNANLLGNAFVSNQRNIMIEAINPDTSIVPIGSAGQHATYFQNLGTRNLFGLSIRGNYVIQNNTMIFANYQYLGKLDDDNLLDNVAAHKLNIGINTLIKNKLNINIRGNFIGKTKAPSSNRYFYEKTDLTIQEVGYDYVTEENPDGFLDEIYLIHTTITGKNLIKSKSFKIEPQLTVRNLLNIKYAYMGRQAGSGVRPVDGIQTSIFNPNGFIPAYHPQAGRQIFIGIKFLFD